MNDLCTLVQDPRSLPARLRGGSVAIGNFDGVHLGHQALLAHALAWAAPRGAPALLLTFEPHPRQFFAPTLPLFRLTPPDLKAERAALSGISAMVACPFNATLAALTAEEFCRELLSGQLGAAHVVTGEDFHFGKGRSGDITVLARLGRELGYCAEVVPPVDMDGSAISSSRIRARLAQGDIAAANRLLGWEWSVSAEVSHGDKRGRDLGYPTANLHLDPAVGLAHGIYAVRAIMDGISRPAVASFGRRPTFDGGAAKLEVHVFDFAGDLYGRKMTVSFVGHIRQELKFDSIDALVARMDEDSLTARSMIAASGTARQTDAST